MNAIALQKYYLANTSAAGSMFNASTAIRRGAIWLMRIMNSSGPATASAYPYYPEPELTSATPFSRVDRVSSESTAVAMLEIRRLSGLTWDELADLFEVSRRSVHHWASGKHVTAEHEQALRGVLTAVRHLNRGEVTATRALLLTNDSGGNSILDLLKARLYDEAVSRVAPRATAALPVRPLSPETIEARRVPHPTSLLNAEQDRPVILTNARIAHAVRVPKTKR
jgi:DNA-binding transcriptional regulator YiaG